MRTLKRARAVYLAEAVCLAGMVYLAFPGAAGAQDLPTYSFDMPRQDLGDALRSVAKRAGWELYATAKDVNGVSAPALHGDLTAREAILRLLRGTRLHADFSDGVVKIRGKSSDEAASGSGTVEDAIVVTGSRIVGAPPAAPVTTITSDDVQNAGQNDLGEVARSLPQNFGGGQNPGIANSQGNTSENSNVNGASTFNLRGIGPSATLTLINGNRVSYSGLGGAIDISAIPIAAVKQVEVVADGASAIYGSDAVAGVVNIQLKPDYSGLWTSVRVGGATDGGDLEQQYSMVTGTRWSGGGIMATYDFSRNNSIRAGDRSFTASSNPDTSLYPAIQRHDALVTGHERLTPGIELTTDMMFKTGVQDTSTGNLLASPITYSGGQTHRAFQSFSVLPSLNFKLPSSWTAKVSGAYGSDETNGFGRFFTLGAQSSTVLKFDNKDWSLEGSAQGPLFALPAGDVRLAFGAGIRRNTFLGVGSGYNINAGRTNHFAYAEAYAPLISPQQGLPFLYRVSLTGAVRAEDYSGSSRIATPKVGLIVEPFRAISFKGSWGRSYKLPTLYQQYQGYQAFLLPATGYGSNATQIYLTGGNSAVQAEHSENLTLTATFKPSSHVEITTDWFHINYTNRVVQPLTSYVGAIANPADASLVTLNPTSGLQAALGAGSTLGLQNITSSAYNPANVVAIVDARYRNIARQIYKGVDLSGRYHDRIYDAYELAVSGDATWLTSRQQLLPGQAWTQLAGTVFYPPHFKARGGVTLSADRFTLASFVSYTGDVTDARLATPVKVGSVTTVDLTARLKLPRNVEIAVNALNIFNAKPSVIYTTSAYDTSFDSTNYSAVGRFLGLTASKAW